MPRLANLHDKLFRLGERLVRWRRVVLAAVLLIAALLALGLPQLRTGFRVDGFFHSDDPVLRQALAHYGQDGFETPDRFLCFGWPEPAPLAADSLERLERFAAVALGHGVVQQVCTLGTARLPGRAGHAAAVAASRTWRQLLVSSQQDAVGGIVVLRPGFVAAAFDELVDDLRRHAHAAGRQLNLCGLPLHNAESRRLVRNDLQTFLPIGTAVSAVFLFWLVPHWLLALLALSVVPLTLVSTLGVMALAGVEITMLTSTLPTLLLCMSVADGLHMVLRFLEERQRCGEPRQAAARTFAVLFVPCLMTSLTTVLGFATLCTAGLRDLQHLGGFAALGMGFAFVFTMTVLPAAMSYVATAAGRRPADPAVHVVRLALRAHRLRPGVWLAVGAGLLVVGVAASTRLVTDHRLTADLWPQSALMQQIAWYEARFVGMMPSEVVVETKAGFGAVEQRQLATLCERIEGEPGVSRTLSIADLWADGVPPLLTFALERGGVLPAGFLARDGRTARVLVFRGDLGSTALLQFRDAVTRAASDLDHLVVRLAGLQLVGTAQVVGMTTDLQRSFVGSFVLILVLVWWSCRSLRLATIAMLSCLLPMFLVLGFMAWQGITMRPLTVISFCVALGLMIDDAIHLVARWQEERRSGQPRGAALQVTLLTAGRPVVVTTLLLLVGFVTILGSEFRGTYTFGLLVDLSLLLALGAALFVLPAMLRAWDRPEPGDRAGSGGPQPESGPP
ncbi:MAG: MMPL family transporter [Planctomycetes bacterium]|nr:MMPL family transporter [Planctomycetota bacterium]